MSKIKKLSGLVMLILVISLGIFLRIYKINFGLPYNFIADETDIYDSVIKFSLNYKFILADGNLQDFSPTSYVYGMFPTYFLTFTTMVLNKSASVFNFHIKFELYHIYLRIITAAISLLIPLFSYLIFKEMFKKTKGSLIVLFLTILNWKLIVYSRYLNQDIYLTALVTSSLFFLIKYLDLGKTKREKLYLIISSIFFGFAIGTKITALISIPVIISVIFLKGRLKDLLVFILGVVLSFSISNPFSVLNFNSFLSRVVSMKTREAGVVFSSVNQNPFKYINGLSDILTIPVFCIALLTIVILIKETSSNFRLKSFKSEKSKHILLIGNFLIYLIFFSLNKRLVERWMLPIVTILCVYAAYGITKIGDVIESKKARDMFKIAVTGIFAISYFFNAYSLFKQINLGDTRVSAYLWTKEYLNKIERKNFKILVYTNKGRDPFSQIDNSNVKLFEVYESKNAEKFLPADPKQFDLVIIYSEMKNNYNSKYVIENYPNYNNVWISFQEELDNKDRFKLIKSFETTQIDLLGLSDIYIYQKIRQ